MADNSDDSGGGSGYRDDSGSSDIRWWVEIMSF